MGLPALKVNNSPVGLCRESQESTLSGLNVEIVGLFLIVSRFNAVVVNAAAECA